MSSQPSTRLPVVSVAGATTALVLLTALNFVNYIDRYILPGVQEIVKREFQATDERIGALTFWFMVAYVCASPFTGWLGDRLPRKPLIVGAALFCSGINFFTATVHTFGALMLRHAALGIGEACFGIFGPALLADFYPERAAEPRPDHLQRGVAVRSGAGVSDRRLGGRTIRLADAVLRLGGAGSCGWAIDPLPYAGAEARGERRDQGKGGARRSLGPDAKPRLFAGGVWAGDGDFLARRYFMVDAVLPSAGEWVFGGQGGLYHGRGYCGDGSARNGGWAASWRSAGCGRTTARCISFRHGARC